MLNTKKKGIMKDQDHNLIDKIPPYYGPKVKMSGWTDGSQSYPFDNVNKNGASHYKTFGSPESDNCDIPKTTTQEAMENGSKGLIRYTATRRSVVNFTSFIGVDEIIAKDALADNVLKIYEKIDDLPTIPISTYTRDYNVSSNICRRLCTTEDLPHKLFNRRPQSEFGRVARDAPFKFMDEHFVDIPPPRKCINYLRQIRNTSLV